MIFSALFSLLLLFGTSLAACKYKFIHNASELIEFSNDVNNGNDYSDYTVYLVADIKFNDELSQRYNPVGIKEYPFQGTFDGQGYVVSNLKTSSSLWCDGLFGCLWGTTIRNVVVDDSCSITNSGSKGNNYNGPCIGGIIGKCGASSTPCIIENCVNMGSVTYKGSTRGLYVGGIGGWIGFYTRGGEISNCVNYGTISASGTSKDFVDVGGIVAEIYISSGSYKASVYNCLNYGTIKDMTAESNYFIGGIDGHSHGSTIENCVNVGAVSSSRGTAGGIIGNGGTSYGCTTTLTHCYWTGTNYYRGSTDNLKALNVYKISSISSTYAGYMNSYVTASNGWNKWTYNQNSKTSGSLCMMGKVFLINHK